MSKIEEFQQRVAAVTGAQDAQTLPRSNELATVPAKFRLENLEREAHYVLDISTGLVVDGPFERLREVPLRLMGHDGAHRVRTGEELQAEAAAASTKLAEQQRIAAATGASEVPQIADLEQRARDAHGSLAAAQEAWDQTHSEDQGAYNRLEAARNAAHEADEALAQQKVDGKLPGDAAIPTGSEGRKMQQAQSSRSPFGLLDIRGKYPRFESTETATRFAELAREEGDRDARVTALSSVMMTSDNTPVVLNVRPETIEKLTLMARYGAPIIAYVSIGEREWPFFIKSIEGKDSFVAQDHHYSYMMQGDATTADHLAALRARYGQACVRPVVPHVEAYAHVRDQELLQDGERKIPEHGLPILHEPDPRPVVALDPTRPLYDEAGREYQVVSSSSKQVVTNSHGVFGVWDLKSGECLIAHCEGARLSNERPAPEWVARRREATIDVLSGMHADAAIDRARESASGPESPSSRMRA